MKISYLLRMFKTQIIFFILNAYNKNTQVNISLKATVNYRILFLYCLNNPPAPEAQFLVQFTYY